MSTTTQEVEALEQATRPENAAALTAGGASMFAYSRFVHVGPGARACEEVDEAGFENNCGNPLHFHAWVRLPNAFQRMDIVKKAGAAAAVAETCCRTEGAEAHAVLESDLYDLRERGASAEMVAEILRAGYSQLYLSAMEKTFEDERFEHIEATRERLHELDEQGEGNKPAEEQSDEYKVITTAIGDWIEALKHEMTELERPDREALEALPIEELVDRVRAQRIRKAGETAHQNTMALWTWFVGTLKIDRHQSLGVPTERMFTSIGSIERAEPGAMWSCAPEVIDELREAFAELNKAHNDGVRGNPS